MSSSHTPNYQLSQWEAEDKVLRTDFNADNAKIDAAIKAVDEKAGGKAPAAELAALAAQVKALKATIPRVAAGTYTGSGQASRYISVGFDPKAVLIMTPLGETRYGYQITGGLAVQDGNMMGQGEMVLTIDSKGFTVCHSTESIHGEFAGTNDNGVLYHYLAVG